MRAARIGADGTFQDADGRALGNHRPRRALGQVPNEMFRDSVQRLGQATATSPPSGSTPIPALRKLAETSAKNASGYSVQVVDSFVFPKMSGDPTKDLIVGQFVFPKTDPMPVYAVSARPTKSFGAIKLMKIEKGGFGPEASWTEIPLEEFRRDYMVVQPEVWSQMETLFTVLNPKFEDGKVSAESTKRVGIEWSMMALDMAIDGLNEKGLAPSELTDKTIRTAKGSAALTAYVSAAVLAYEIFDMASAGMDTFWIGPKSMMLFRTVATEIIDFVLGSQKPGLLQLTTIAISDKGTDASYKAAGDAYVAMMERAPYWNTLLMRIKLRTATERANWVALHQDFGLAVPVFTSMRAAIDARAEEIKQKTGVTNADLAALRQWADDAVSVHIKTAADYYPLATAALAPLNTTVEESSEARNWLGLLVRANADTVKDLQKSGPVNGLDGLGAEPTPTLMIVGGGPRPKSALEQKARNLIDTEASARFREVIAAGKPELVPLRERILEILQKDFKELVNTWTKSIEEHFRSQLAKLSGADVPKDLPALRDGITKAYREGNPALARHYESLDQGHVIQTRDALNKINERADALSRLITVPVEQGGGAQNTMSGWMKFFLDLPAEENLFTNTAGIQNFVRGLNELSTEIGYGQNLQALMLKVMYVDYFRTGWKGELIKTVDYLKALIDTKNVELGPLEARAKAGEAGVQVLIDRRKADIKRMEDFIAAIDLAVKGELPAETEASIRQAQADIANPNARDPREQIGDAQGVYAKITGREGKGGAIEEIERSLNEATAQIAEGGALASVPGREKYTALRQAYDALTGATKGLKEAVEAAEKTPTEGPLADLARKRITADTALQAAYEKANALVPDLVKLVTGTKTTNRLIKYAGWIFFPDIMANWKGLEKLQKVEGQVFAKGLLGVGATLGILMRTVGPIIWGAAALHPLLWWTIWSKSYSNADPRQGTPGGPGMTITPPPPGAAPGAGLDWWQIGLALGVLGVIAAPQVIFPFIGTAFKSVFEVTRSIFRPRREGPGRPGFKKRDEDVRKLKGPGRRIEWERAYEDYKKAKEANDATAIQKAVEKIIKAKQQGQMIPSGLVPGV